MISLPQEILDAIIEVVLDIDTLKAASLACKCLIYASQRQLFRTIHFARNNSRVRDHTITHLIQTRPHIAIHVRIMSFGGPEEDIPRFLATMATCTNLRYLDLTMVDFDSQSTAGGNLTHLPSLQTLRMFMCTFDSFNAWWSLLCRMTRLNTLLMHSCDFRRVQKPDGAQTLPFALRRLGLGGNKSTHHIISSLILDRLAELELELTEVNLLRTTLIKADASLTTVRFVWPHNDERDLTPFMIDFCDCLRMTQRTALRTAELHGLCNRTLPSNMTPLNKFLSNLSSPVIERMALHWEQPPMPPMPDAWAVFDNYLSSSKLFPSLQEVAVYNHELCNLALPFPNATHHLPRLTLRGLLLPEHKHTSKGLLSSWL